MGIKINYEGKEMISELKRLGGSGQPSDMNNKIEIYEAGENKSDKKLLLTIYEVWDTKGYFLKIVKSETYEEENTYIKTMVKTLFPLVTVLENAKMELVQNSQ